MVVRGRWISPHEKAERGGRTRSAKWTLVASVFMPSAVDGTVVATVPTDSCPQERPSLSAIGRRRQAFHRVRRDLEVVVPPVAHPGFRALLRLLRDTGQLGADADEPASASGDAGVTS